MNTPHSYLIRRRVLPILFFASLMASVPSAQNLQFVNVQPGQPLVYRQGAGGQDQATTDPSGTVVDIYVKTYDSHATFCQDIYNVWNNSGAPLAATIDARGYASGTRELYGKPDSRHG